MPALLYPFRKPCPFCGNPMKRAPNEIREGYERYVCAKCDDTDPLNNTVVQRWMESSLKPPGK
jgi:transposase-like protein